MHSDRSGQYEFLLAMALAALYSIGIPIFALCHTISGLCQAWASYDPLSCNAFSVFI